MVPAVAGCCFAGAVVLADFCDDAQALNKVTPMAAMITDLFIITKFWLLNIIAVRVGQAFFRINAKIFVSNGVYRFYNPDFFQVYCKTRIFTVSIRVSVT